MEGYLCLLAVILMEVQQLMVQQQECPNSSILQGRQQPPKLRSAAQQSETPETERRERDRGREMEGKRGINEWRGRE